MPQEKLRELEQKRELKSLAIALAATGVLIFLAFAIVFSCFLYKKIGRKQNKPILPSITEEHYERITYHTLASGTNGFSEANLLGERSFGAVYKCSFQDEGTIAAVKVFKLHQSGSTRSFVAKCKALKRVRHRSLVKSSLAAQVSIKDRSSRH
ncbi:hypothetical protein GQ55_1G171800 [Panicum hallii var. hallii]|jgi:hypothetical protein|uniref:Protein kinase domain-containing protein n=1 Tax=Panicum hallii var. hallii TaxID=1504633 RepID=A0A2T7F5W5_9POAL|nr:hypothetical protein GQ55_1G171800 [Panicum hallii var. hallii]